MALLLFFALAARSPISANTAAPSTAIRPSIQATRQVTAASAATATSESLPAQTPTSAPSSRDTSPAAHDGGYTGSAILLGLLSGVIGSLISAIASTWYLPKRQHEFWLQQQHVGLCMKAYEKLMEIVDEFEKQVYYSNQRPGSDFTKRQLSIAGDIRVLFGESPAWQKFVILDTFMTTSLPSEKTGGDAVRVRDNAPPKYSDFVRVRDNARTALLHYIGIRPTPLPEATVASSGR
ncbi:MAG: hypothetical protein Q7S58_11660 [Candidatus Binatus sp.]|uniref:hypothetical protein n=1 Tax=Candidatus Binatus sp. TaxID=2811406 RepID=UPI00271747D2|nr:hypothetical protein [Candidatus Binatus sp.]MDO8433054.1 hypothetical protein [Candidatus Binatus sp.]